MLEDVDIIGRPGRHTIAQLKALLTANEVDYGTCKNKGDYVGKLQQLLDAGEPIVIQWTSDGNDDGGGSDGEDEIGERDEDEEEDDEEDDDDGAIEEGRAAQLVEDAYAINAHRVEEERRLAPVLAPLLTDEQYEKERRRAREEAKKPATGKRNRKPNRDEDFNY